MTQTRRPSRRAGSKHQHGVLRLLWPDAVPPFHLCRLLAPKHQPGNRDDDGGGRQASEERRNEARVVDAGAGVVDAGHVGADGVSCCGTLSRCCRRGSTAERRNQDEPSRERGDSEDWWPEDGPSMSVRGENREHDAQNQKWQADREAGENPEDHEHCYKDPIGRSPHRHQATHASEGSLRTRQVGLGSCPDSA